MEILHFNYETVLFFSRMMNLSTKPPGLSLLLYLSNACSQFMLILILYLRTTCKNTGTVLFHTVCPIQTSLHCKACFTQLQCLHSSHFISELVYKNYTPSKNIEGKHSHNPIVMHKNYYIQIIFINNVCNFFFHNSVQNFSSSYGPTWHGQQRIQTKTVIEFLPDMVRHVFYSGTSLIPLIQTIRKGFRIRRVFWIRKVTSVRIQKMLCIKQYFTAIFLNIQLDFICYDVIDHFVNIWGSVLP